jgi:hypothetical protein
MSPSHPLATHRLRALTGSTLRWITGFDPFGPYATERVTR